jgi:hypothetical protein
MGVDRLIHLQTLFQLQVAVRAHKTVDKILTDLEGYPHKGRPGLEERLDPDIHARMRSVMKSIVFS